jgi:tRNA G18 (ribose-2'-O)-methylase SpoU
MIVHVADAADPRLADYVALTDPALRRRVEPATGVFIAEGEKIIRRAVDHGYELRSLLLAERWLPGLHDVVERNPALPVFVASTDVLRRVTGYHVHRGALAAVARPALLSLAQLAEGAHRLAVLHDLVDPQNVGSIFRAAAALGMDGVVLSRDCADPLYRRSVRVSMGAVLTLPYARFGDSVDGLRDLRTAGFQLLALTPARDAVPLPGLSSAVTARCALLLGTEGEGLPPQWLAESDLRVRIPMSGGIDSLNVATAAAVACYGVSLTAHTLDM